MKTLQKLSLAAAVAAALLSSQAMADAWTLTQEVTASTDSATVSLLQSEVAGSDGNDDTATSGSQQSMNTINLSEATLDGSSQTVNLGSNAVSLTQDSATTNSGQFLNNATAATITDLTQTATAVGNIGLNQNGGVGSGNTQAVNQATAATAITSLKQSFGSATNTTFAAKQEGADKNTQAGNLVNVGGSVTAATTDGDGNITAHAITQTATVKSAEFSQKSISNSFQAGNAVIAAADSDGSLSQSFTSSGNLTLAQEGVATSHQHVNYVGAKTISDN